MSGLSQEEVKKHVRVYGGVFIALAVLTGVTVAVSYLHLSFKLAVLAALSIAALKASLVAAFFMHLAFEKKIVFAILIVTGLFFLFLLTTPSLHYV